MIKDVVITNLDVIPTPGGNVMHAIKDTSEGFMGFEEAYFSLIDKDAVKAWKRHKTMTLNLVVPLGEIKFVLFDDRDVSKMQFQEIILSLDNYCRLTVPPMIWIGFQGLISERSILLNISNIKHNPEEIDRLEIDEIKYNWSIDI